MATAVPTPITNAVEIFIEAARACRSAVHMTPRSANDKEYFAQDWFADRLNRIGLTFVQQGRNSYPDFIVNGPGTSEGYELKSLAFANGRPARTDIDFNSTIPSGFKDNRYVFLVFILYTGTGINPRPVHSISIAHADLINADHALADEHLNVSIRQFGSYADGFIRNRKMYVFPHPIIIAPTGLGRHRLIVPQGWNINDTRLRKVHILTRTITAQAVDSFTIRLHGRGQAQTNYVPYANAGTQLLFDVFETVGSSLHQQKHLLRRCLIFRRDLLLFVDHFHLGCHIREERLGPVCGLDAPCRAMRL